MAKNNPNRRFSYKQLSLRLSHKQINSLNNYCEINGVTPNKLIKNLLKTYVEDYTDEKIGKVEEDKKQLKLFTPPSADDFEQLSIFSKKEY
jgi:hypothetical protein